MPSEQEKTHASQLNVESPYKDRPEDDVACAWCGAYRTLYGGLNFDGEAIEDGDYVCRPCAENEGVVFDD